MAEWREIPAQRVLVISFEEAAQDFQRLDENGALMEPLDGRAVTMYRRLSDSRLFKLADWHPANTLGRCFAVREI